MLVEARVQPQASILRRRKKVLDYIVVGRRREILVVVDGPRPNAAKDMTPTPSGHHLPTSMSAQ